MEQQLSRRTDRAGQSLPCWQWGPTQAVVPSGVAKQSRPEPALPHGDGPKQTPRGRGRRDADLVEAAPLLPGARLALAHRRVPATLDRVVGVDRAGVARADVAALPAVVDVGPKTPRHGILA